MILRLIFIFAIASSSITAIRPLSINLTWSDLSIFTLALLSFALRKKTLSPFHDRNTTLFYYASSSLIIIGFLASSLTNPNADTFTSLVQYIFCLTILPYVIRTYGDNFSGLVETSAKLYVYVLSITCLLGYIAYQINPELLRALKIVSGSLRFQGFAGNPNQLSAIITLTIPVIAALSLRGRLNNIETAALSISLALGLMIATSVGGIASALLTTIAILAFQVKIKSLIKFGIIITLGLSAIIYTDSVPEIFKTRIYEKLFFYDNASLSDLGSYDARAAVASEALERIQRNPIIGIGLENYLAKSEFGYTVHNTFILVWAEGGILALLGILFVMCSPCYYYVRMRKSILFSPLLAPAVGSTVAMLCASQTFAHIYSRLWFIPTLLVISLMILPRNNKPSEKTRRVTNSTSVNTNH